MSDTDFDPSVWDDFAEVMALRLHGGSVTFVSDAGDGALPLASVPLGDAMRADGADVIIGPIREIARADAGD